MIISLFSYILFPNYVSYLLENDILFLLNFIVFDLTICNLCWINYKLVYSICCCVDEDDSEDDFEDPDYNKDYNDVLQKWEQHILTKLYNIEQKKLRKEIKYDLNKYSKYYYKKYL